MKRYYFAVDKNGNEYKLTLKWIRQVLYWTVYKSAEALPPGTIEKITKVRQRWTDEPLEWWDGKELEETHLPISQDLVESIAQAITDPENQPNQYGVTLQPQPAPQDSIAASKVDELLKAQIEECRVYIDRRARDYGMSNEKLNEFFGEIVPLSWHRDLPKQPAPQVLREKALNLVVQLDYYAREYNSYEYGLPTYDEHLENLVNKVSVFAAEQTEPLKRRIEELETVIKKYQTPDTYPDPRNYMDD